MTGPYGLTAAIYRSRGWLGVMPLPAGQKYPPPSGFTGFGGAYPDDAQIAQWLATSSDGNVALRMPPGVLGIDVDAYGSKTGGQSLSIAEQEWGELPPTWRVTSRSDGISGIRFFRVPEGLAWPSVVGPGIETVHRGHRYAVTWPSIHPEGGRYEWLYHNDQGTAIAEPPTVNQLPWLPATWVEGLTKGEEERGTARAGASTHVIAENLEEWETEGGPCRQVLTKVAEVDAALHGPPGSRHDTVRDKLLKVIRLGQVGHSGVGWAMDHMGELFIDVVGPDRGHQSAEAEWRSLVQGGADVILGDMKPRQSCYGDRCEADRLPSLDLPVVVPQAQVILDPFTAAASAREEGVGLYADLGWVAAGGVPPQLPMPEVFQREDGIGLFYHGKINGIYGEPETAKTWLALAAIVEALRRGERAVFLDVDHNGAEVLASRLVALQASSEPILHLLADPDRFRIALPESPQDLTQFVADMREWLPGGRSVAVIDSLGEVIPMYGAASKDNDQITTVLRLLARPLAQLGSAVILIDHVAKGDGGDSGYAIGGTAKKRAINGSYIKAMTPSAGNTPRPGGIGKVQLMVEKNRDGHLRRYAEGKHIGTFVLDSSGGMQTIATFQLPAKKSERAGAAEAAAGTINRELAAKVCEHLAMVDPLKNGKGFNVLFGELKGNRTALSEVLKRLVEDGFLATSQGARGSTLYSLVQAYDPLVERVREGVAQAAQLATGTTDTTGTQGAGTSQVPVPDSGEATGTSTGPVPPKGDGTRYQSAESQPKTPRRKPEHLIPTQDGLVNTSTGELKS